MRQPTVAIIGSGFSGISAAVKLKKELNIVATVFEATKDIGGTWHYNTYPGCACDIPSHLYSFSFENNPNWTEKFSSQREIHEYMQGVARKYGVYEQTEFETYVVRASWIEEKKQWELEIHQPAVSQENQIRYYDFIYSCVGGLRIPLIPDQFKPFEGKIIHSSYWDNDYDFNNKKVAVIGSGTSAIQIVPSLVPIVKHLYNYQRTPAWVAPKNQFSYPKWAIFIFTYIPFAMLIYRAYLFLNNDFIRYMIFKSPNTLIAKEARRQVLNHMKHSLRNRPDLMEKLIPNYALGCKRIGQSDDYLEALCSNNATVNCSPITQIEGRTIKTADGTETEVDVLVLATGFDVDGFLGKLQLYGRNKLHLNKLWEENPPKTFKTVSIHGFPNFFMTLGPNSGLGHNSVVTVIECQVDYSIKLIKHMLKNNIDTLDPTDKAQEKFMSEVNSAFKDTTWSSGCNSWYLRKDGVVQSLWPHNVTRFWRMLRSTDYDSCFDKN